MKMKRGKKRSCVCWLHLHLLLLLLLLLCLAFFFICFLCLRCAPLVVRCSAWAELLCRELVSPHPS